MTSVGSFEVTCYHESLHTSRVYCDHSMIPYQPSLLPLIFPHLQTLSLAGVYPQNTESKLGFPWDQNNKKLPLNLSESRLNQELPNDKNHADIHGIFSRSYASAHNRAKSACSTCPYERLLNSVIFSNNSLLHIPFDCFNPGPAMRSSLQVLDLSKNNLTVIQNKTFDKLSRLENLHLSHNSLTDLQIGLFDDLVRLRVLNLCHNVMRNLRTGLFSKLKSLTELYVYANRLVHTEHQTLPIYSPNLLLVDLRWNELQHLPADCFTLPNLFACDCRANEISLNNFMDIVAQFDPVKMAMVEPMAYYGQPYSQTRIGGMHQNGQRIVKLGENRVEGIGFNDTWPLEKKKQLAALLSFIQIDFDSPMDSDNNIKYLPISIQIHAFTKLSISGNKLQCDCTTFWMKSWLQKNNISIANALGIHCQDQVYPIVQMEEKDFVCQGILLYLGTILGLSFTVVTVIMVSIACYIYEFEIKVLLFEKLNWHPFDKQIEDEEKEHDAYLMYCTEDESWVISTLLAGLERSGYRTCVPDRDFTIGASTAEEMAQAFSKTHRVIVVISQSFVDNTNAMSDFFHAYNHDRSATQKRFLVLIKLQKDVKFGDRNEIFKRYISTNYYVSVRSKTFWPRLQYWLPNVKRRPLPDSMENIEPELNEFADLTNDIHALVTNEVL
ncbi:toll-like receptor 13 [Watersipora subatra]|uniref:toll-like receptor 13 n=1 Tax=Watersipora subatra TaxID=2589382 RepID=UPI00355B10A6